jgi:haloalkane dehalogenase
MTPPALRRPAWLPEPVWPFQTSRLQIDGTNIAVTDVGRGPTVLFVHTGLWSFIWRDAMLRLASDFRCICFDAPGTGQSDRLPTGTVNLERAARASTAVLEALDLRDVTLVVHDLGGLSGIAGAARVPERVRALCAVNSFAWRPSGLLFRAVLAFMGSALVREIDAWTGALARLTSTSFGVGRHLDRDSRAAFLAGIGRQGLRAFHRYLGDARRATRLHEEVQGALTGSFQHLPLSTVFGERNDPLGFQPRWKALFPTARQMVVPKGNHFPMCDDPDLVAAAVRQLDDERAAVR